MPFIAHLQRRWRDLRDLWSIRDDIDELYARTSSADDDPERPGRVSTPFVGGFPPQSPGFGAAA